MNAQNDEWTVAEQDTAAADQPAADQPAADQSATDEPAADAVDTRDDAHEPTDPRAEDGPDDAVDGAAGAADFAEPDGGHPVSTASIIEAILFATESPVSAGRIAQIVDDVTAAEVKEHVAALNQRYQQTGASFRIEEIAKGYQMLTLPAYNEWLKKLLKVRSETKLTRAALETLAVVAYKQPVLRVEIEEIRGVAVGEVLQRLREMNLVKIAGRAEIIGRPLLYGTTKYFLEVFGLGSLKDLPKVEELTPPEQQRQRSKTADRSDTSAEGAPEQQPDETSPRQEAGRDADGPEG